MTDTETTGPSGFRCEVTAGDPESAAVVRVFGEIDMTTAGRFQRAVDEGLDHPAGRVVVDLGGVPLLTSSGLSVLARAHEQAHAQQRHLEVRIAGAPRIVGQAIKAVGLDQVLIVRTCDSDS